MLERMKPIADVTGERMARFEFPAPMTSPADPRAGESRRYYSEDTGIGCPRSPDRYGRSHCAAWRERKRQNNIAEAAGGRIVECIR